jgi:hypothetical protein
MSQQTKANIESWITEESNPVFDGECPITQYEQDMWMILAALQDLQPSGAKALSGEWR